MRRLAIITFAGKVSIFPASDGVLKPQSIEEGRVFQQYKLNRFFLDYASETG